MSKIGYMPVDLWDAQFQLAAVVYVRLLVLAVAPYNATADHLQLYVGTGANPNQMVDRHVRRERAQRLCAAYHPRRGLYALPRYLEATRPPFCGTH